MAPTSERSPRVAILIVNGFRRRGKGAQNNLEQAIRYPWIDLCLRQIERHSQGWDYQVTVFDNSHLELHRALARKHERVTLLPNDWVAAVGRAANRVPVNGAGLLLERSHPAALDYLARRTTSGFDYLVTLDNDSFPVRDDWLDVLVSGCEQGAALAGVYRDEMAPLIEPFIHVSGLCVRPGDLRALGVPFGRHIAPDAEHNQDVGQKITYSFIQSGRTVTPLKRSNRVNVHFLMGAIYGDVIYHHGAGSRRAIFWTSSDRENDERVHTTLRNAAFADLDHLLAVLRGEAVNDLGLAGLESATPQPAG
jgi:hypothetical protein